MEASLGKQYADLMFLNDPYNFSLGDDPGWTNATEAEHQPKAHAQPQPERKEAPAPAASSWTCPRETIPSPENCQSLSPFPFTLCTLSLSFSPWCYQDKYPNLCILLHLLPHIRCTMQCSMSLLITHKSPSSLGLGEHQSSCQPSDLFPTDQERCLSTHGPQALWPLRKVRKKSKRSCYLTLQDPYLLT